MIDLSIVVPVYNSAALISTVADRLMTFLDRGGLSGELIFVDDGSNAETWTAILSASKTESRITGIRLAQNYGQHSALMCGLRASSGRWVVTIDDDLENPPEEIGKLLEVGHAGSDLVFGQFQREQRPFIRRLGSCFVNAINRIIFRKPAGITVSNFRLMSRDVVDAVCRYSMAEPYITGLASLHARNPANAIVRHEHSYLGDSRYSLGQLLKLTKIVFAAGLESRLRSRRYAPAEKRPYHVAETAGNVTLGTLANNKAPHQAEDQPGYSAKSGLIRIYRRIFAQKADWRLDVSLVILIAVAGFVFGYQHIQQADVSDPARKAVVSQALHAPAVMVACGRGFVDVEPGKNPHLDRFLNRETETISCQDIPADSQSRPPDGWQKNYLYLMYTLGFVWTITGVSIGAVYAFYGVVFAAALSTLYGIMRQAAGPVIALATMATIGGSNLWLSTMPSLYYFIKAPFFLAALMLLLMLALKPPRDSRFPAFALILGLAIGISLGFRRDLLALIPLCVLVLLFYPRGAISRRLSGATVGLTAFFLGLITAGWPILSVLSESSNTGHLALIGLSGNFTQSLGISPSFYDWGRFDDDIDIYAITNAYNRMVFDGKSYLVSRMEGYDRASLDYFRNIVATFPADYLLRPVAGALKAFVGFSNASPLAGLLVFGVFLALLAKDSLRVACLCLLIFLYIAGYPAFLFRSQDYFHLLFIPLFLGGFILQRILESAGRFISLLYLPSGVPVGEKQKPSPALAVVRSLGFPGTAIFLAIATILFARNFQDARLEPVLERYWSAPTREIAHNLSPGRNGTVNVTINPFDCTGDHCTKIRPGGASPSQHTYLMAQFDRSLCNQASVKPKFSYGSNDQKHLQFDFSRTLTIPFENGSKAKVFFSAFSAPGSTLKHISLSTEDAACLQGVHAFLENSEPRFFLFMAMTDNWRDWRRHMILSKEKTWRSESSPQVAK